MPLLWPPARNEGGTCRIPQGAERKSAPYLGGNDAVPSPLHPKRDNRSRHADDLFESSCFDCFEDRTGNAIRATPEIMKRNHAAAFHEGKPGIDVGLARVVRMIAVDENEIDRAPLRRERLRCRE